MINHRLATLTMNFTEVPMTPTKKVTDLEKDSIWKVNSFRAVKTSFGETQVLTISSVKDATLNHEIWANTKLASHASQIPFLFKVGEIKSFTGKDNKEITYRQIDIIN